jgi:hypothetical protein
MEHRWHLPDNDHKPAPVPRYPASAFGHGLRLQLLGPDLTCTEVLENVFFSPAYS